MLPYYLAMFGDREKRREAYAMRFEAEDLPGGPWKVADDLCVRSGFITPHWKDEVAKRSRKAGGFSAWRLFKSQTRDRELWLQTGPYGTDEDAFGAVPRLMSMMIVNPLFKGQVVKEQVNESIFVTGVDRIYALERWTDNKSRGTLNTKYIIGSISRIVFVVVYSDWSDSLTWDEVSQVAEVLAERVHHVQGY